MKAKVYQTIHPNWPKFCTHISVTLCCCRHFCRIFLPHSWQLKTAIIIFIKYCLLFWNIFLVGCKKKYLLYIFYYCYYFVGFSQFAVTYTKRPYNFLDHSHGSRWQQLHQRIRMWCQCFPCCCFLSIREKNNEILSGGGKYNIFNL